ncbi:Protein ovarian tumor locus [Gryllus bimaculatus]|nr:Protein ovarian tumor locus [Gryllus bimaculatus]
MELEQELYNLKRQLSAEKASCKFLQEELEILQKEMKEQERNLNEVIKSLREEIDLKKTSVLELKIKVENLEEEREEERKKYESEIDLLKGQLANAVIDQGENSKRHLTFQSEMQILQDKIDVLEQQLERSKSESEKLLLEKVQGMKQYEEILEEKGELKNALTGVRHELASSLEHCQALQEEVVLLKVENNAFKSAPQSHSSKGNSVFAEVDDNRKALKNSLDKLAEKSALLRKVQEVCANQEINETNLIDSYKARIKDLETIVEDLKKDKESCDSASDYKTINGIFAVKNKLIESLQDKVEKLSQTTLVQSETIFFLKRDLEIQTTKAAYELTEKMRLQELVDAKTKMSSKKFFSKVTEPIDQWLEIQGLYRKHTAHDPSCLFRAVAEQVYFSQCCHEIVRKQCVHFMAQNKSQYEKMVEGPVEDYLYKLNNSKEWGSQLELNALSLLYQREIVVFEQDEKPRRISINNAFKKCIMLCYSSENHYDSVYPKSYIMKSAFCQSLVYEILYKKVFRLIDVDFAVDKMLRKSSHTKREHYIQQNYICASRSFGLSLDLPEKTVKHLEHERFEDELNAKDLLLRGITPFPYKVAKALDPDIYRNIEFDVWSDLRREMKLGIVGGKSDELQIGVKCLVKMQPDRVFHAHIQEMEPNNGPVIVFVEELGKKCTVSHDVLEPLPKNQKVQWTVPYKQHHINTLASKAPFLNITELSSKWRKNKYNKSRKLKDIFMPASLQSFHQDPSQGTVHYPMDHFNYNSNISVASSEECSNESSHMIQADNAVNSNMGSPPADSTSPTISAQLGVSEQNHNSNCNPPFQIVGVPMYHSVCPDSSGIRVSTPSIGSPMPSYILCNGNPQGRVHPGMENFTLQPVNFYAPKSVNLNGNIPTLRFYYNLGHDFFRSGCVMWPNPGSSCSPHLSPPPGENNSQLLPDSTVPSEEDSYQGPKMQTAQPAPAVHQQQQTIPLAIPQTITHTMPITAQVVPQVASVPQVSSSAIVSNMLPQMVPVSPSTPHPMSHPQSTPKLIQQPSPSPPPPHTMCPILPKSPPLQQPMFGMNNIWPQQTASFPNHQQRVNIPESDNRSNPPQSHEDSATRGIDAVSMNTCQGSLAAHPPVLDSYTHSPIYPYYVVEMDSVPFYNPYSFVMQPSSEMDVISTSQIHAVQSPGMPSMPPVLYHSQPVPHGVSAPHWISSDGVPQYTVAM